MTNERKALNDLSNMVNEYYRRTREHGKAVNTIKQALERLEQLEKENQELKAKADKYDELCSHNVLESQSFGVDLIEAILNQSKRVNNRNKKLTKAISILKEETELRIAVVQGQYLIQQGAGNVYVSKEKGELLSEVLGE